MEGLKTKTGEPIKGRWGQWYRHDEVTFNGARVGFVQVRRRYFGKRIGHRIEATTHTDHGSWVLGRDLEWLLSTSAAPAI